MRRRFAAALCALVLLATVGLAACDDTNVTVASTLGTPPPTVTLAQPTPPPLPGTPQVALFSVTSPQTPVFVGGIATTSASCPPGAVLVSGGYATDANLVSASNLSVAIPDASYPASANTWTVAVRQPASGDGFIAAQANCLKASFPVTAIIARQSVNGASATATCPAGTTLTGGGFVVDVGDGTGSAVIGASQPAGNGWRMTARPPAPDATVAETAYALCATGIVAGSTSIASASLAGVAGNPGALPQAIVARCPSGQLPVGGGHSDTSSTSAGGVLPLSDAAANGAASGDGTLPIRGWSATAINGGQGTLTLTVFAVCVGD